MVYIPEKNLFVVEIPKNASRSLAGAAENTYPVREAEGHVTLSRMFKRSNYQPNPDVVAVLRNPVSRAISAINYTSGSEDLDTRMEFFLKSRGQTLTVARPQTFYLDRVDEPHQLHLIPMNEISRAFEMIGSRAIVANAVPHKWTREQICSHDLFFKIMDFYQDDLALWEQVTKKEGRPKPPL